MRRNITKIPITSTFLNCNEEYKNSKIINSIKHWRRKKSLTSINMIFYIENTLI